MEQGVTQCSGKQMTNQREMQVNLNSGFKIYTSKFRMVDVIKMKSQIISFQELKRTIP